MITPTPNSVLKMLRKLPPHERLRVISLALPEIEQSLSKEPQTYQSLRGLWKKFPPAPSADEIDETRTEIWKDLPREGSGMIRAVADTHAVIWYLYDDEHLSVKAKNVIEQAAQAGEQIGFSAISMIEIVYLVEKGRIKSDALEILIEAIESGGSALVELPVTGEVAMKMREIPREAIPDMPDRIIAATAQLINTPIISRDGKIKISGLKTIW